MDLARAMKRLHDLPGTMYRSHVDLALAYLRAGCEMFGFQAGALRGDENVVYDPKGVFQTPGQRLQTCSLNGHGQVVFAGPQISAEDTEILDLMVRDLARELLRQTTLTRLS